MRLLLLSSKFPCRNIPLKYGEHPASISLCAAKEDSSTTICTSHISPDSLISLKHCLNRESVRPDGETAWSENDAGVVVVIEPPAAISDDKGDPPLAIIDS